MKKYVKESLRKFGLQLSRFQVSPYEYLKDFPRYTETTVDLLGQDFKIADSSSFCCSFQEVFFDQSYKFTSSLNTPVVLDCGSNYGVTVIYFKSLYPDSKITAVEADPEIFKILKWNIQQRGYKGVTLVNKAVSSEDAPIKFYQEGADGGRTVPNENCNNVVDVFPVHLDDLIDEPVDFLKMDIEGAETESICSSKKLKQVANIFIEYHSFKSSEQTLSALLEKLSSNGFRYYIQTEFCSPRPLTEERLRLGMDLQLNIFAARKA